MKPTTRTNVLSLLPKLIVLTLALLLLTLLIPRTHATPSQYEPATRSAPPVAVVIPEGALVLPEYDYMVERSMSDESYTTFLVLSEAARITCPIEGLTNPRHPDAFIREDGSPSIQGTTQTVHFTAFFHGVPQECFYLGPWVLPSATNA